MTVRISLTADVDGDSIAEATALLSDLEEVLGKANADLLHSEVEALDEPLGSDPAESPDPGWMLD